MKLSFDSYLEAHGHWRTSDDYKDGKSSISFHMYKDLMEAASDYVQRKSLECHELEEFSYDCVAIVENCRDAFTMYYDFINSLSEDEKWSLEDTKKYYNFFWHGEDPFLSTIDNRLKIPTIDRNSLENAVFLYMKLPFGSEYTDKLLIQFLMLSEIYPFIEKMSPVSINFLTMSTTKRNINNFRSRFYFLRDTIFSNLKSALIYFLVIGFLAYLAQYWVGFGWISALIGLLFLLDLGWSIVATIIVLAKNPMAKIRELLDHMQQAYLAIASSTGNKKSVRHIRDKIEQADAKGVVWPSDIYPLLEYIEERGVKTL